jgi:hypothetical protein
MTGGLDAMLLDLVAVAGALALAVALLRLGLAGFDAAAPRDAEAVPLLRLLAVATGALLGVALLLAAPHVGAFLPDGMFAPRGPWSIGLRDLLVRHAVPAPEAMQALVGAMVALDALAALPGWIAAAGAVQGAVLARRLWYGPAQRRAFLAFLFLALHMALLLHWTAHLLAWIAAQLGIWLFALALLLFQRWRYRPRGAH